MSLGRLDTNRFNKVQLLLLTEDLLKVRHYMRENIVILTEELKRNPHWILGDY